MCTIIVIYTWVRRITSIEAKPPFWQNRSLVQVSPAPMPSSAGRYGRRPRRAASALLNVYRGMLRTYPHPITQKTRP